MDPAAWAPVPSRPYIRLPLRPKASLPGQNCGPPSSNHKNFHEQPLTVTDNRQSMATGECLRPHVSEPNNGEGWRSAGFNKDGKLRLAVWWLSGWRMAGSWLAALSTCTERRASTLTFRGGGRLSSLVLLSLSLLLRRCGARDGAARLAFVFRLGRDARGASYCGAVCDRLCVVCTKFGPFACARHR